MLSAGASSLCLSGFFFTHAPDRRLVGDDLVLCSPQGNFHCLSGFCFTHAPDRRLVGDDLALCSPQGNFHCVSLDFFLPMHQTGGYSQCDGLAMCSQQGHLHCVSLDLPVFPCSRSEVSCW